MQLPLHPILNADNPRAFRPGLFLTPGPRAQIGRLVTASRFSAATVLDRL